MQNQRIRELVSYLPEPCPELDHTPAANSPLYRSDIERTVFALTAADFGAHYLDFFLKAGVALPNHIHDRSIRRGYEYHTGAARNPAYARALELHSPGNGFTGMVLEAYLLCRDLTIEQIAERVQTPVEAIEIYADLYFNVRSRASEQIYIASIVYPQTRIADLRGDFDATDMRQHLLKLAHEYGSEAVDSAAGIRVQSCSAAQAEKCRTDLENRILLDGLMLITLGAQHSQKVLPGLQAAIDLMLAPRTSGQDQTTMAEEEIRPASISVEESVLDAIQSLQTPANVHPLATAGAMDVEEGEQNWSEPMRAAS
jgi:hypothetical protein